MDWKNPSLVLHQSIYQSRGTRVSSSAAVKYPTKPPASIPRTKPTPLPFRIHPALDQPPSPNPTTPKRHRASNPVHLPLVIISKPRSPNPSLGEHDSFTVPHAPRTWKASIYPCHGCLIVIITLKIKDHTYR